MNNKLYGLAFLLGLTVVLSGASGLKRMGIPLRLEDVTSVQAAAVEANGPDSGTSGDGYSLDWYTLDGGCGNSAGDAYQMTATIAQADAGTSSGGAFTIQSGFLPGTLQSWHEYLPMLRR